jgi:hypothetical protein
VPTDRTVKVRLTADPKGFIAGMKAAGKSVADLRHDIDTTNDRTAWLAQSFLALGPSLVPIGAAGVPALAGMTTQLGLAAGAAGVAALAFNGIGDALKALDTYQIDPTTANLEKLNEAMAKIGPDGAQFVRFLDSVGPAFADLANTARGEMFPGVEDGIRTFVEDLLPRLKVVVGEVAGAMGDLAREAGEGLSGPKFERFFEFLRTDAQPLLMDMGRTVGNFATGFANLVVAFGPLTEKFSKGLLRMSRSFAEWSSNLDSNASFQSFLEYIEEVTPRVLALFEALVDATVAIVTAAAPVGEVMLPAFTGLLRVIESLAGTPLGPIFIAAAAAASLYGRSVAAASLITGKSFGNITRYTRDSAQEAARARLAWRDLGNAMIFAGHSKGDFDKLSQTGTIGRAQTINALRARDAVKEFGKQVGGTAGQVGLLAFAMSDLDDKMGLTNTAMGALIGSMLGPWGAAAGAAIGFTLDFAGANDELVASIERANAASASTDLTQMLEARAGLIDQIAQMKNDQSKGGLFSFDLLSDPFGLGPLKDGAFSDDVKNAESQLGVLDEAIRGTRANAGRGLATAPLSSQLREVAPAAEEATVAVDRFADSLGALQSFLDRSGSLINYERALDDLTASIEENGNTWEVGTEAGRKNLEARNDLVNRAIERAEVLRDAGDKLGAQKILGRAITDLEAFVGDAKGAKREAIQPLLDLLEDLDKTVAKPGVKPKTAGARGDLDDIHTKLMILDNFVARPRVVVARDTNWNYGEGPGFAEGGYTGPGGKYEPAGIVHRGEFVFDQATTSRNRGLFEAIHKGMAGYANGGYVQATAAAPAMAPALDYDRLGATIARNSRQMFGETHFHNGGDYDRAKQDALAAKGGG